MSRITPASYLSIYSQVGIYCIYYPRISAGNTLLYLTMTPISFHILLALALRDEIAGKLFDQIQIDLANSMEISRRSYYAALKRLTDKGWIDATPAGREVTYHLLPPGRRMLQREKIRYGRAAHLLVQRL
jgi:DNA-binding MarR family transcriptional regulator